MPTATISSPPPVAPAPVAPISAGQRATRDLTVLLRARTPLVWIQGSDERAILAGLSAACGEQGAKLPIHRWDVVRGLADLAGKPIGKGVQLADPIRILVEIGAREERGAWVLLDYHPYVKNTQVVRSLRNLAQDLPIALPSQARAIVLVSPIVDVPPELRTCCAIVDWPLPDRAEVASALDGALLGLPEEFQAGAAPNGKREQAIDGALGLSLEEIRGLYAQSLVRTRIDGGVPLIDPVTVSREKARVVKGKGLEVIDAGLNLADVGGLNGLKTWLNERHGAFSADARAYGLPPPKGIVLVGPPGTGKSLVAKTVAGSWGMPLLRLDLGAVKDSLVGSSERNIRHALKMAESVAPCVLWVDEIEKALAGSQGGGAHDGGVSSDALSAVLGWMQDRAGSVFVVATANDVAQLPPELLRKGRFDELFFVDLPTSAERAEILTVALRRNGRAGVLSPAAVASVASSCSGFSGAELAALIPSALYGAFADGKRPINAADLMREAGRTVPLSTTAGEKLAALRKWATERARPASIPDPINSINAPAGNRSGALDI